MLKLILHLAVRAEDETDLKKISAELRRRIETQPALQTDCVKAIAVLGVERRPEQALERPAQAEAAKPVNS